MSKISGPFSAIAFLLFLAGTPAQAAQLLHFEIDKDSNDPFNLGVDKTNNDCSGYFGQGFENCMIAFEDTEISPVIIKFNENLEIESGATDEDDGAINTSLFPSVTGDEWEFITSGDKKSGTWNYTPGANDPGIRFWAAKAGPGFKLFWEVDDAAVAANGVCDEAYNTLACLMAANPVTTGTWSTPDGKGLSHLTFYDSAPSPVPVPAAFWLFGTALIGFVGMSRRRKVA